MKGMTLHNIKVYYMAPGIFAVWYLQKDRHPAQWVREEILEIEPGTYTLLNFVKGTETIQSFNSTSTDRKERWEEEWKEARS